jgi:hypothetical protein
MFGYPALNGESLDRFLQATDEKGTYNYHELKLSCLGDWPRFSETRSLASEKMPLVPRRHALWSSFR